jgi:hypothetical protein
MALTDEDPDISLAALAGDRVFLLHGRREDELRPGRDVDCLVEGLDPRWPLRLTGGWRLCQWQQYDLRAWYWVVERDGEFVALDTTDDPEGFGRDAVRTRSILAEADGGSLALTHAAYLTVKRTRKGEIDPSEWARIGKVVSRDPVGFAAVLERLAGTPLSSLLSPVAAAGVVPLRTTIRRANHLRWMRRFGSPSRAVRALSLGARRYVDRVSSPSGLSVLVVGPDGSGKSTLAARLPEACAAMFRRYAHSHWRPGILPRPGAVLGRARSDPTRPHARGAFGRLPSALLLAYYWIDFLAGSVMRDLPVKVRSGLIVRERGWWDLAVDPRRYRMQVAPQRVRMLGELLPRPDLVIVLHADPDLLRDRKPELERHELERQLIAWRTAAPGGVPSVRIDVSRPPNEILADAVEAVVRVMESRAVSRLEAGWATLPGRTIRWWLPRAPRAVARTSVSVYQPMTSRARVGWTLARMLGGGGGFTLLPRGSAPPPSVRRVLAPHIPQRGTVAVGRATHPGRFVALILDEGGRSLAVAKIASDPGGSDALEAEEASLGRFGEVLTGSVVAPRVLHAEPGLLLLEPFEWIQRRRPWELEEPVARALGEFFGSGKRPTDLGWMGPAHGDCAPWNLLRTSQGWALVDWESADEAPAFHDVCHYVVQSHALLGRPFGSDVVEGFLRGRGWVGRAISAYAEAADISAGSAPDALAAYLERSIRHQAWRTGAERKGAQRRRRLLHRLDGRSRTHLRRC